MKLTLLAIACTLTLILMEVLDLPTVDTIVEVAVEVHCIWLLVPFSPFCLTNHKHVGRTIMQLLDVQFMFVSLTFCLLYYTQYTSAEKCFSNPQPGYLKSFLYFANRTAN